MDSEEKLASVSETVLPVSEPKGQSRRGLVFRILDGFKPASLDGVDTTGLSEHEIQDILTAKAPLKRNLNGFQISLIAIGGSIGSGLFVGTGNSMQTGGPGGLIIGFAIMGYMIFCTMQSVGALATHIPLQGSYVYYSGRFLNRSLGCALSWSYIQSWLISVPLELISAALTISYWDGDNNGATRVNKAAWVALFYVFTYFVNLFGVSGYGYAESILSMIKILAVIGFIIFGIVVNCGGYPKEFYGPTPDYGPGTKYIGGYFWNHPGAFVSGVKSVITVMINAAFSYGGVELSALAAAESKNPRKTMPRAIKQVFWRILLFFILSLIMIGFLVPYTDSRLGTSQDGRASPFVIAIRNAGIQGLPSVFNVVILLSILSVGNAGVYATSRCVASMAAQGFAPRWFGYIDRHGRPLAGLGISALFSLLGFLAAYSGYGEVFNWLQALSGLSSLFIWACMNLSMLRFYQGLKAQGRSTEELAFEPIGRWFTPLAGFVLNMVVICLEFWIALYPIGKKPNAKTFFKTFLSAPVFLLIFVISKWALRDKKWYIKAKDMDLDTGTRNIDIEELKRENREEAARVRSRGYLYRIYNFWC